MRSRSFQISSPGEQFAEEIRRRIAEGRWGDRLPGITALTREFGVSRKAVEKAFRLLEGTGELKRGGGRGEMMPVRGRKVLAEKGTLIVYTLHAELHGSESLDILQAASASMPPPVVFLRLDAGSSREEVIARVAGSDAGTIILMHQPWGVGTALTAAGRRVIMFGSDGPGATVPLVAMRHESVVREAFRCAFEAGHKRVCLPLWRRNPGIVPRMREWVADEYRRAGLRHSPEFDAPLVDEDSGAAMGACIRSLFRHTPPTALVLQNLPQWIATIQTLSELRLRVPQDVSIVMLSHIRELAASSISYAHLRYPVPTLVAEVRRMIRRLERGQPGGSVILDPIREPGESLARLPR